MYQFKLCIDVYYAILLFALICLSIGVSIHKKNMVRNDVYVDPYLFLDIQACSIYVSIQIIHVDMLNYCI